RRGRTRAVLLGALGALVGIEAWAVPLPLKTAPTEPAPADRWLAASPVPGPVVALPMYGIRFGEARRMLSATAHWRPLVNGYSGFYPAEYSDTVETLNAFPSDRAVARLRALGVRYVVLHLPEYPGELRARVEAALPALAPGLVQVAAVEGAVIL